MKHRLNLVMSDHSKKRLDRLITLTDAETSAEVIKNALRLYEAIINRVMSDEEFLIRNKKTGDITIYPLFEAVGPDEAREVNGASRPVAQTGARAELEPAI